MIKIPYANKHRYSNLVFAIIWILLALLNLDFANPLEALNIIYLITGIFYLVLSVNFYFYPYVSWDKNQFKITQILGYTRKVSAKNIVNIEHFGGDYILKTTEKKVRIKGEYLDKEAKIILKNALDRLNFMEKKVSR